MPFITTDRVSEIRNQIKKEFPEYRISVTRQHRSTINVAIMSGPIDLLPEEVKKYRSINEFHIDDWFKDSPAQPILSKLYSIINAGNRTVSEDGDYGSIPAFYCDLNIGKWDRPYEVKKKNVCVVFDQSMNNPPAADELSFNVHLTNTIN